MKEMLQEVLGSTLGRSLRGAFEFMEVAEDEIAAAKERWPLQASTVHGCFMTLRPHGNLFQDKEDRLYRLHCRELLNRAAEAGDLLEPTKAELACVLCDASQVAPLDRNASALYMNVFRDLFPDNAFSDDDHLYQGEWEGAVRDLERDMRKKLKRAINRCC